MNEKFTCLIRYIKATTL